MKHYLPQTYARVVYSLLEEKYSAEEVAHALIRMCVRNRDMNRLQHILPALDALVARDGKDVLEITSAHPIDIPLAQLREALGSLAKDAVIEQHTDPSLIGGMKLLREDRQIDLTAKASLQDLSDSLQHV